MPETARLPLPADPALPPENLRAGHLGQASQSARGDYRVSRRRRPQPQSHLAFSQTFAAKLFCPRGPRIETHRWYTRREGGGSSPVYLSGKRFSERG